MHVVLHGLLQPPQLLESVCVFTHAPLQFVCPVGQTSAQLRFWHVSPCAEQLVPHPPQFGSLVMSKQLVPQQPLFPEQVPEVLHTRVPPEQCFVPFPHGPHASPARPVCATQVLPLQQPLHVD